MIAQYMVIGIKFGNTHPIGQSFILQTKHIYYK